MKIKKLIFKIYNSKHERSKKAIINVILSFLLKGSSIIIQIALVPLTLNYLNKYQYGIWLTLASIFGWFSFFDVGIGNGLRNKLAEALANNDVKLARIYVSTSYAFISLIFMSVIILFYFINPLLNWSVILNVSPELSEEISRLTIYVFTFFSLRFIFGLIGNILFADQRPALNNLIGPLGNFIALIGIVILKFTIPESLFHAAILFSGIPLFVYVIFNLVLFSTKYKFLLPSIKFVRFKFLNDLLGLGMQFFVIQLAAIILFTTSNILLTRFYGPDAVTSYNIAFKYFTIVSMMFGIIVSPYWSAITESFTKKDFKWIRSSVRDLDFIAYGFILICILMFFISDDIYILWVGSDVIVPKSVSLFMAIFVIVRLFGATSNTFINGAGKIRLQLYTAFFTIIFTVPLAYLFCIILDLGPAGVIMATLCTTLPTSILWKIQYNRIISGNAQGIWNK